MAKCPLYTELAEKFWDVLDTPTFVEIECSTDVDQAISKLRAALTRMGILYPDALLKRVGVNVETLRAEVARRAAESSALSRGMKSVGQGAGAVNSDITCLEMFRYCSLVFDPDFPHGESFERATPNPRYFFDVQDFLLGSDRAKRVVDPHRFMVQFLRRHGYVLPSTESDDIPSPITPEMLAEMEKTVKVKVSRERQVREELKGVRGKWEKGPGMKKWKGQFELRFANYKVGNELEPIDIAAVLSSIAFKECDEVQEKPSLEEALARADRILIWFLKLDVSWEDLRLMLLENRPELELPLRNAVLAVFDERRVPLLEEKTWYDSCPCARPLLGGMRSYPGVRMDLPCSAKANS